MSRREALWRIQMSGSDHVIDLRYLNLLYLPEEIGNLTHLELLNLGKNRLMTLPSEIGCLKHLKSLYLDKNQLTELPQEIGELTQLRMLYLGSNQLADCPASLGRLKNLETLELEDNRFTLFPSAIESLLELEVLDLHGNRIRALPPGIGGLSRLRSLDLRFNNLEDLPDELALLDNLKVLLLEGNPLTGLPPALRQAGAGAVLSYLRSRAGKSGEYWDAQAYVLGPRSSGKTSLVRRLAGNDFNLQEEPTLGIRVTQTRLNHPDKGGITMNLVLWEVGRQRVFEATHNLFGAERALFLVCWDGTRDPERSGLYFWLDQAGAKNPRTPVLLVATHGDRESPDLDVEALRTAFPQVVGFWPLSCRSGEGLEELKTALAEHFCHLPHMGEVRPVVWIKALAELRAAKHINYLDLDRFWGILAKAGLAVQEDREVLFRWLREMGEILLLEHEGEAPLVVLRREWLAELVDRVLREPALSQSGGLMAVSLLKKVIWTGLPPSVVRQVLMYMARCDLAYPKGQDREAWIVPLCAHRQPADYGSLWKWKRNQVGTVNLAARFQLDVEVPIGLISWLVVRLRRFSLGCEWRHGVLVADDVEKRNLGLVMAVPYRRLILLNVAGPDPGNFFALLCDALEQIFSCHRSLSFTMTLGEGGMAGDSRQTGETEPPFPWETRDPGADSEPEPLLILNWDNHAAAVARLYRQRREGEPRRSGSRNLECWLQREFLRQFRELQRREDCSVPNLFALRPIGKKSQWRKEVMRQKMELQLYCQEPGAWHPTVIGGRYELKNLGHFLEGFLPYFRRLTGALTLATPWEGPWTGMADRIFLDTFADDVALMQDLLSRLVPQAAWSEEQPPELQSDPEQDRTCLAALRRLLVGVDPSEDWGGLMKTETPEGHLLWLCGDHRRKYLP